MCTVRAATVLVVKCGNQVVGRVNPNYSSFNVSIFLLWFHLVFLDRQQCICDVVYTVQCFMSDMDPTIPSTSLCSLSFFFFLVMRLPKIEAVTIVLTKYL